MDILVYEETTNYEQGKTHPPRMFVCRIIGPEETKEKKETLIHEMGKKI